MYTERAASGVGRRASATVEAILMCASKGGLKMARDCSVMPPTELNTRGVRGVLDQVL